MGPKVVPSLRPSGGNRSLVEIHASNKELLRRRVTDTYSYPWLPRSKLQPFESLSVLVFDKLRIGFAARCEARLPRRQTSEELLRAA